MNAINRFRIFLLSSFVLLSSTVFPHSFVYAGDDASLSEMHWRRSRDSGVKSFDWWPTDAAPQPAPDGRPGRNGSWWWPEIPGQIWPLWGNRGFPYVLKTISTAVTQKLSKEKTEERISETSEVLPLQAEKVSEPSLASEAFSSKGEGGAKRDCWLCFDWGLHAGYRVDDFRWSTAGNTQGTNPDILTESTWRNLDIYQMQLDGELLVHKSYVLKGLLSHGWIFDGKNRTSEYSGNNRTSETRRWDSESNEGTILDLSGALGYRLKPWERFSLTPLAGYSYHEQNFKLIRPPASIPDLDSTYEAQWWGPWAGADLAYRPDKRNTFFLNFEYHWAKYEAEADWNLRGGNLAHPKSFEHSADAEGVVVRAGWAYALNKRWSTRLTLGVQDWETRSGTETTFFGNGTTGNTRLNKVEWDSFEVMAGFHYNLDERCAGWEEEELGEMGEVGLTGDRIKLSGKYRLSGGIGDEAGFILNDSNADLQERNWRYVFGERLNNTYDPSVYSQYLLNVDFSPLDKVNIFTQIVADPWSYVGTTGDQVVISRIDSAASLRYNLKYFGAFNSTLNEIYRTPNTDSVSIPIIKVHNGHLAGGTVVRGFNDYNPATNGVPFVIPEHEVDFEFRPIRKLWVDAKKEENWRLRVFALADENQALTTDDPLELSNHKQYWQQSPWLHQYKPIQFFTDRSIKRGYYSDALSFLARDSQGNRLVLLRGASFEGNFDKTYLVSTVAAPFTPWDEE
ncbi:MAG: hypothetical protein HY593_01190, partial [Candidatus Omnitrophica bacterium]|nr:hypothetical protein [Candidatus Omnitrophota bacterium]